MELRDGRFVDAAAHHWDRFWHAFSDDEGLHWREFGPTGIDAGSAPGYLLRLASGRLVFVWNRLYPEGETQFPRRAGQYSDTPTSWHRLEMSISFSEDDADIWTRPQVITRHPRDLSYLSVFERRPGELWVTSQHGKFVMSAAERDLLG